jgi:hypothetical protein
MKGIEKIIELLEYGTSLLGWAVRSLRSFPVFEKPVQKTVSKPSNKESDINDGNFTN